MRRWLDRVCKTLLYEQVPLSSGFDGLGKLMDLKANTFVPVGEDCSHLYTTEEVTEDEEFYTVTNHSCPHCQKTWTETIFINEEYYDVEEAASKD